MSREGARAFEATQKDNLSSPIPERVGWPSIGDSQRQQRQARTGLLPFGHFPSIRIMIFFFFILFVKFMLELVILL